MHRFIRLYRKTGWSISDLDRTIHGLGATAITPEHSHFTLHSLPHQALQKPIPALGATDVTPELLSHFTFHSLPHQALQKPVPALGATDITPELLIHFAEIKRLQADYHITNVQILLSFWAPIETAGQGSLYHGLFLNKATHRQGADPAFEQAYPDSEVLTNTAEVIESHLPVLQSAFRITAPDLALILQDSSLDPATAILSLDNVSALYRRAALAKMLKLKVKDFLTLKAVSGCDPFASPEQTRRFSEFAATIAKSGLTPQQLNYIVRHIDTAGGHGGLEPRDATVLGLATTVRNGMAAIVRDNVVTEDPTGSVTAQKLASLFESDVVDGLMGIFTGTVNYSATLIAPPAGFAVPKQLAKKVTYDPNAQLLICKSPLTSADRTALFGVATDAAYRAAVESLYQQPLDLIKSALGTFWTRPTRSRSL